MNSVRKTTCALELDFFARCNPAVIELKGIVSNYGGVRNIEFVRINKLSSRTSDVDAALNGCFDHPQIAGVQDAMGTMVIAGKIQDQVWSKSQTGRAKEVAQNINSEDLADVVETENCESG